MVACCGRAIAFSPTPASKEIIGFSQYPKLENYSVMHNDPLDRIKIHMGNYVPSLVYAVCKSKPWKSSWRHTLRKEFPAFAIGELQFEMCMSYAGKSKVIPQLMWLRSHGENTPVRGTDLSLDPKRDFPTWWDKSQKSGLHNEFLSIMTEAFGELQPAIRNGANIREAVVAGVKAYLSCLRDNSSKVFMFRSYIAKQPPGGIKSAIKRMGPSLNKESNTPSKLLNVAAKELEGQGVCVDFAALLQIERFVQEFHKGGLS
jgi:hypothetical protein